MSNNRLGCSIEGGEEVNIILYLSVALIAVAFFLLVIYLIKTLKTVQGTLQSLTKTIEGMEKQIQAIGTETAQLLHKTNAVVDDVQKKVESINVLFEAVKQIGSTVQTFNDALVKKWTANEQKLVQAFQWSNAFLEIWGKWKEKKKRKAKEGVEDGKK
ncbi:hypothetical protein GFC30_3105 (plasmid) [Anoxybacillus amylolyticus]|uniref:General stress protein n=1 Tax=Anoxybacteroides amylolyticum TaxID=294699 RepID=A0A167TS00_9BACL|nr:hypothetical protein GFC30_3105 [Anoxybacillus amylolyticus]